MSDVVIRAKGLGKKYVIGHRAERERYVALRDVVTRSAGNIGRKVRDLFRGGSLVAGDTREDFWALKDIDFEVKRGEVLGIIGRNGAGKSTLLKILSRITEPSEGRVTINGRVASLLEVGTGFHPELTGRENIYLNGAILGMTRAEIRRKFDEIVSFSGVEKFLDTPVKRYSSGMYVRLAFAVAAHLDPEILVVDEVLAVGDAEFQKKCLGKISEVAGSGRTVFFVSHNMSAVRTLTQRVLYLKGGHLSYDGSAEAGVELYMQRDSSRSHNPKHWGHGHHTSILAFDLLDGHDLATVRYKSGTAFRFRLVFQTDGFPGLSFDIFMRDQLGARVGMASSQHFHAVALPTDPGRYSCILELEPMALASGSFSLDIAIVSPNVGSDHYIENALEFECIYQNKRESAFEFRQDYGLGPHALVFRDPIEFRRDATNEAIITDEHKSIASVSHSCDRSGR